ncbi:protein translocase subunit SecD [Nocardioides perillae]|uniref:Multifunctional fusion protein n=1 Tax=Nocardioides perillae TaxID=1119534 RepID=A0A7Y9RYK2_9ACTN|nr:protein translocase subunit SecD [Nocardioides perillae]NYG56948.1 SecD/SecF fusion protein [Nocardioides perillae]
MSRGILFRLVLVLGLLAGCAAIALNVQPRLGLDLSGGVTVTLELQDTEEVEVTTETTEQVLGVIRNRVDALGVSEPTVARQGENRILVELPGLEDQQEAVETLGRTAQLTIHEVVRTVPGPEAEPQAERNQVLPTDNPGEFLEIGPTVITGDQVTEASAQLPQNGVDYVVQIGFDGEGGNTWQQITAEAACLPDGTPRPRTEPQARVAIVLDEQIISSPPMSESVGCAGIGGNSTEIQGGFSQAQATELADLIEGGSLPVPVEVVANSQIGPTLGQEAIDDSLEAGVIGLVLTGLFIVLVYRFVGFLATLALTTYALISYATLLAIGATLTLPGLAGFVLAIGLAIDANVLVFERAREEFEGARSAGLRRSLKIGFDKAWSAILDSQMTTLLAAALLFVFAVGPVRGFGVTLSIGVIASLISALVVARVLTEVGVAIPWVRRHPGFSGIGSTGRVRQWLERRNPDWMGRRKLFLGISGAAVVLAVAGIALQGLNFGVEFSGGRQLQFSTTETVDADEAREAVADAGFPEATVQRVDDGEIAVRTGDLSFEEADTIEAAIAEAGGGAVREQDETIGASFGTELRNKALIAFGIALLVQMAYLAFRFKWTFGVSAVAAMAHDVLIVVGLFAWLERPIDSVFLAAVLSIIGLSVNDTVVTFDRVRERWYSSRDESFLAMANRACIETMPRTINTGLGAMFILGALAVLGGDSLRNFSLALLVGLVVGTYSSAFTATPLLTYLQERSPMSRVKKQRVQRDPEDSGAVV